MKSSHFIINLKKKVTPETWAITLSALRQDGQVWESIVETDLGRRVLSRQESNSQDWSPAALALFALSSPCTPESLASQPLQPLPQPLRSRVARAYEDFQTRPPAAPTTLAQAGLWALSLRERRRIKGSWDGLIEELGPRIIYLGTVLACLYAIIPDSFELLNTLLKSGVSPSLVIHAILSNPLSPDAQTETFYALLSRGTLPCKLQTLRLLEQQRPAMAATLAKRLLNQNQEQDFETGYLFSPGLQTLEAEFLKAETHRLAELPEQGVPILANTLAYAQTLLAHLSARYARALAEAGRSQQSLEAWKQAVQFAPAVAEYSSGLAMALLDAGRPVDAQALLAAVRSENESPHPSLLLAQAVLASNNGDSQTARQTARLAFLSAEEIYGTSQDLYDAVEQPSNTAEGYVALREFKIAPAAPELFASIAQLFLKLCQFQDAIDAARQALFLAPNRPDTLAVCAEAELALSRSRAALVPVYAAAALQPSTANRHLLVRALEAAGEWENALDERSHMLAETDSPSGEARLDDLHNLAYCALQAQLPQRSIQACREALVISPHDGLSFALLGEAYAALGDHESALGYLDQAIQFSPSESAPWLSLSRIYKARGHKEKALEILRTGSLSSPESAEIHLALGLAYLDENVPTQAISSLRQAAALATIPNNSSAISNSFFFSTNRNSLTAQIAYHLGKTLHQLGYIEEALQVLERAYNELPLEQPYPDLAYAYARILITLNQIQLALCPLQQVINSQPDDPSPYLDYARALLQVSKGREQEAQQVIPYLHQILQATTPKSDPKYAAVRFEALALLAEALAATGDLTNSSEAYRQALETPLAQESEWRGRLSSGLGRVALALGQYETAITALQEAANSQPENVSIQCNLTEAYLAYGLLDEALSAARAALHLNPNDLETLIWFANQAQNLHEKPGAAQLGAQNEAISALSRAAQMAPNRSDLLIRLGKLQMMGGDSVSALETFSRLSTSELLVGDSSDPTPHASLSEIFQAAQYLRQLDAPEQAVALLEKAINGSHRSPDLNSLSDTVTSSELLAELAEAHRQSGNLHAALQSVEHAITLTPNSPELFRTKSDLLILMDRQPEALTSLQNALAITPNDADLHYRIAQLLRYTGAIPQALSHAEQAATHCDADRQTALCLQAECLAAELAYAMLQPQRALLLLRDHWKRSTNLDSGLLFHYSCLRAELALECEDDVRASEALVLALDIAPHHPRCLALQARLLSRRPETDPAQQAEVCKGLILSAQKSVPSLDDPSSKPFTNLVVWRGLAEAAVDLGFWDFALDCLYQAVKVSPEEPISHFQLARALVQRAEAQQLAQLLEVVQHAPGEAALSVTAAKAFEDSISSAERLLNVPDASRTTAPRNLLERWRARGHNIFSSTGQAVQELQALLNSGIGRPEDAASLILAFGKKGSQADAIKTAQHFPNHPWVLLHLALVVVPTSPRQALGVITSARTYLNSTDFRCWDIQPRLDALVAQIAVQTKGTGLVERATAIQSIQAALQSWPEEPRWHALAAQIYLQDSQPLPNDLLAAISHLQKSAQLEPGRAVHYLDLGRAYLTQGEPAQAITALEQACRISPENSDNWLALAKAQQAVGNLDLAAESAEKSVETSDDPLPSLLLRGQISLEANNPHGAQSRAQAILRLKPGNPEGLHLLAQAYEAMNQPEEAVEALDEAIPQLANPLKLHLERARLIRKAEGNAAALKLLQQLSTQYVDEPSVLSALAQVCFDSGQSETGLQAARQAIQADQGQLQSTELAELHYRIGLEMRASGQLDLAIHQLNEAVHNDPNHIDAFLALGKTHMDRRQHTQALHIFQQAIQISGNDHRPYYQAALVLKDSKDYLAAEEMLRKATELAPNDVTIHRLLGAVVALNLVHNRRQSTPAQ